MKKQKRTAPITSIPKGLDIGTTFIYSAKKLGPQLKFTTERNCFFDLERNDFIEKILEKSKINAAIKGDKLCVVGEEALRFANLFRKEVKRSLKRGVISPEEKDALPVLSSIIKNTLGNPTHLGTVFYSIPGTPVDADFDVIYHQQVLRRILENLGYTPNSINEGLAVIYSELTDNDFTGFGISLGGGMVNVCLAAMAVPIISFSVARAGDWIDEKVAKATNETASKICAIKESGLDLTKSKNETTQIEEALIIYYDQFLHYIISCIKNEIEKEARLPKFEKPIPIVISGGTSKPKGFLEKFKKALDKIDFPLEISQVKLASHPLYAVAKGALIAAIAEKNK